MNHQSSESNSNHRSITSHPIFAASSTHQPGSSQPMHLPPLLIPHPQIQVPAMLLNAAPDPYVDASDESWKTATPCRVPPPTYSPSYKYVEFSRDLTNKFANQWVPRVLSVPEQMFYVNETRRLVDRINTLEEAQKIFNNPGLEHECTVVRVMYLVQFGRAFRINDLPTEILTTILRLACWSADTPKHHSLWRLWLTGTCSRFRSVMINDPTLWTAIVFHHPAQLEQTATYLDRSGPLPLDIRIGESNGPAALQDVVVVFELLWKKISQIRAMIVVVRDWDPIVHIFNQLARVATEEVPLIMQHLEFHRTGPYYIHTGTAFHQDAYDNVPPLFGGALIPTLRIISLDTVHTNWQHTRLCNLTTLDIRRLPFARSPSHEQFKNLLMSNLGLKKLLLDGAGPTWPSSAIEQSMDEPVVLHELEELVVGDYTPNYGSYILSLFRAPNLTDLTILNMCDQEQHVFFDALMPLSGNVRILSIFNVETTFSEGVRQALIKWLHSMKHLTYLRVSSVNEAFLQLFMFNPTTMELYKVSAPTDDGIICPNLSFLEMHRAPARIIGLFANYRRVLGCPLKKLYIPTWMRHTITPKQITFLKQALGPPGRLLVLLGNQADEEKELRLATFNQSKTPNVAQGKVQA